MDWKIIPGSLKITIYGTEYGEGRHTLPDGREIEIGLTNPQTPFLMELPHADTSVCIGLAEDAPHA